MRIFTIWLAGMCSVLFFGCGPNEKEGGSTALRTGIYQEVDGDLAKYAPEFRHSVVLHLEAQQVHPNDTEGVGFDTYTLKVIASETRTFCLQNDQNRSHRFELSDSAGNRLFVLKHGCKTLSLSSGKYTVTLYNADVNAGIEHQVYIVPREDTTPYKDVLETQQSQRSQRADQSALARTDIIFDQCHECNLQGLDLANKHFGAEAENLSDRIDGGYFVHIGKSADEISDTYASPIFTTNADVNYSGSNLSGADFSYAVFKNARFDGANLEDANLSHALFFGGSFDGANLKNADLDGAIFLSSTFGADSHLPPQAISKPSASMLFNNEKDEFDQQFATALLNSSTVVFYSGKWNTFWTRALPMGKTALSGPVTIPNNFTRGRSTFLLLDDGVHEYFEAYGVHGKSGDIPTTEAWHKVKNSEVCADSLNAMFFNYGGSGSNELKMRLVCRSKEGTLYGFRRVFLNKYDTAKHSGYTDWGRVKLGDTVQPRGISVNVFGEYVYIQNGLLNIGLIDAPSGFFKSGGNNTAEKVSAGFVSGEDDAAFFSKPSREQAFGHDTAVVITVNGENDVFYSSNPAGETFKHYGHPEGVKIVSGVSLGGWYGYLAVLGNDGHIWKRGVSASSGWSRFSENRPGHDTPEGSSFDRVISKNSWANTYVGQVDFSKVDFGKEQLDQAYFYGSKLREATLESMSIEGTVFKRADLNRTDFSNATLTNISVVASNLDSTNFKGAKLIKTDFSDNKTDNNSHINHVDFSNAFIEDLSWRKNSTECAKFATARFSGETNAYSNSFNSGTGCRNDFKSASNVPVALFYDKSDLERNASVLRFHDFTEATFDGLETLDFIGADMTGARMAGVKIKHMDLNGSVWSGAVMSGMVFDFCSFKNAGLDTNDSGQIRFSQCNLAQAYLKGKYTSAHFDNSDLSGIYVDDGTQMNLAHFTSTTMSLLLPATMKGVNLNAAAFSGVEFYKTDFTEADLGNIFVDSNSKFIECDFSNASVGSSSLNGNSLFGGSCFTKCENKCWGENNVSFLKSGQTQFHQTVFGLKTVGPLDYTLSSSCASGKYRP